MKSEEFDLIAKDGLKLYAKSWLPDLEEEPKVVICLVHGLSEHLGRYEDFALFFTSKGIPVFSFDLRGHGKSGGKRGHMKKYEYLLDDVESLLKIARREYNDGLMFLYGQSLGGNIVANYILKKNTSEVAGAILSAPWFKLAFEPPFFKLMLAGAMKHIYPSYSEKSDIEGESLSKDPAIVEAYNNDPLVHNKISVSLFFETVKNGKRAIPNAFKLTIPLLAIHGKADPLTSWEATDEFVKKAGDKAVVRLYNEVKHEPHNDLEREQVLSDVLEWIYLQSK